VIWPSSAIQSLVPSCRSGNIVPNYLGSRSKLIWNVLSLCTHRSEVFWKQSSPVPRSRSSPPATRERGD
jgi:hypothetical protein